MHKIFFTTVVAVIVTMGTCRVGQAGIISVSNGVVTEASITNGGDTITVYTGTAQSWDDGGYQGTTTDPGSWWGDGSAASAFASDFASAMNEPSSNPYDLNTRYIFAYGIFPIDLNTYYVEYDQVGKNWFTQVAQMPTGQTAPDQYYVTQYAPTQNTSVPEPSTAIAMGLLGIVGFAGNRRRRRQGSVA